MRYHDLTPKSQLVGVDNVIEQAQIFQEDLVDRRPEEKRIYAAHAIEALGDPREIVDSKKLLVHAMGAYVLRGGVDVASSDEIFYHGLRIDNGRLKANFDRFAYVESRKMSSICLRLYEAEVIASSSNPEFVGEKIKSGVYVPVHAVESVMPAA